MTNEKQVELLNNVNIKNSGTIAHKDGMVTADIPGGQLDERPRQQGDVQEDHRTRNRPCAAVSPPPPRLS
jgi:hypothetical protein